jgi:hypothetical protein
MHKRILISNRRFDFLTLYERRDVSFYLCGIPYRSTYQQPGCDPQIIVTPL